MDRFQAMQTFVKVVELSSFSRAADVLGMPRASATITIKNLETRLKVRLLQRTTRRLSLTPEGADYYERCVRILNDIQDCEQSLIETGKGPKGKLRVEMPGSIGRWMVAPRITEFTERYPDIHLVIGFADRPLNLAQSAVDCSIYSGNRHDTSFVHRPLGETAMLTVASAEYLKRHAMPVSLDDLEAHQAVHYYCNTTGRVVAHHFQVEHIPREIKMKRRLLLSDIEAYVACGLAGAGIIQAPKFILQPHIENGSLVEILPQWKPRPIPVSAQYAPDQHFAGKVRVFVEWIASLFHDCPDINWSTTGVSERWDAHPFSELAPSL